MQRELKVLAGNSKQALKALLDSSKQVLQEMELPETLHLYDS